LTVGDQFEWYGTIEEMAYISSAPDWMFYGETTSELVDMVDRIADAICSGPAPPPGK